MVTRQRNTLIIAAFALTILALALYFKTRHSELLISASVWSAFGTFAAAFLALIFALQANQRESYSDERKAATAAVLLGQNVYWLKAVLDVIVENEEIVKRNKDGYSNWLSGVTAGIKNSSVLLEDRHLPFAVALNGSDLFTLVMANSWLDQFKRRVAFKEGVTAATVVDRFNAVYEELNHGQRIVTQAATRLHHLSGLGGTPPWDQNVPSWARLDK